LRSSVFEDEDEDEMGVSIMENPNQTTITTPVLLGVVTKSSHLYHRLKF
jgi:hypothetical protein